MSRTEHIYRIARILHRGGVISRKLFLEELEVSLATFKRYLEYMRDRLNAPFEVVVVGPDELRNRVETLLRDGLARLSKGSASREPAVRDNGAIVD